MVAPAILFALKALAPAAIRAAGNFLGGKASAAAEVVADVMDDGGDLEGAIQSMPPELQIELARVSMEGQKLQNDREARGLEHLEKQHSETQTTARAEQEHGNAFVKETRPKLARDSFAAGTVYVMVFEMLRLFGHGEGADPVLAGILYGPCFQYLGMRTIDKWKGKPGTTI